MSNDKQLIIKNLKEEIKSLKLRNKELVANTTAKIKEIKNKLREKIISEVIAKINARTMKKEKIAQKAMYKFEKKYPIDKLLDLKKKNGKKDKTYKLFNKQYDEDDFLLESFMESEENEKPKKRPGRPKKSD